MATFFNGLKLKAVKHFEGAFNNVLIYEVPAQRFSLATINAIDEFATGSLKVTQEDGATLSYTLSPAAPINKIRAVDNGNWTMKLFAGQKITCLGGASLTNLDMTVEEYLVP